MIAALLSLLPGRGWLYGGLAAGLALLIGWHVIHEAGERRAAVAQAATARDSVWQAEIAAANAATETRRRADQARIDALAAQVIDANATLQTTLQTIEAENNALPAAPSCALDRARVRLLGRL